MGNNGYLYGVRCAMIKITNFKITDMFNKWLKRSKTEAQCAIQNVSESAFTEVYLKNHGWQKLLSQGEIGNHEGLSGIYYLVDGFGKVHEKYCKHFR